MKVVRTRVGRSVLLFLANWGVFSHRIEEHLKREMLASPPADMYTLPERGEDEKRGKNAAAG